MIPNRRRDVALSIVLAAAALALSAAMVARAVRPAEAPPPTSYCLVDPEGHQRSYVQTRGDRVCGVVFVGPDGEWLAGFAANPDAPRWMMHRRAGWSWLKIRPGPGPAIARRP